MRKLSKCYTFLKTRINQFMFNIDPINNKIS